jgi:hypothetical protein
MQEKVIFESFNVGSIQLKVLSNCEIRLVVSFTFYLEKTLVILNTLGLLKTAKKSLSKSLVLFSVFKVQKLIQNLIDLKLIALLITLGNNQRTFAKVKISSDSF